MEFIISVIFLSMYFLPTILCLRNNSIKNKGSLIIVNTFLGWTLVGWVITLSWSLKKA